MKHIIAAIALLTATVPALAQTQLDPRTQDYRMWAAERMIDRLIIRIGKMADGCNHYLVKAYAPALSDACRESVVSLYPHLKIIREVAAGGDDVRWASVINIVHTLERDTNAPLAHLATVK